MDISRSSSVKHWPRSHTSILKEDEVYYIDEECAILKDEVISYMKDDKIRHRYAYDGVLNIFGKKKLVKAVVKLDTLYRTGKIDKISKKIALSIIDTEEDKDTIHSHIKTTSMLSTSKSSKKDMKSIKEYIEDNLDEIIRFIDDNQSDKYFNIITMQSNSFLVSHHSSKLDMKILVPKVFSDNMLKKFNPGNMSSLDVLHMAEDMIIKKKPKLGINRSLEKDRIVDHSSKDDILRRGIDRMVLKGTSRSLSVNKVKGKEVEDVPSRSDVSKSRAESKKPSTTKNITGRTPLFERIFGSSSTSTSSSSQKKKKEEEEFDDEYVISCGEGKDINYEEEEGSDVSLVVEDSTDEDQTSSSEDEEEDEEDSDE